MGFTRFNQTLIIYNEKNNNYLFHVIKDSIPEGEKVDQLYKQSSKLGRLLYLLRSLLEISIDIDI